MMLNGMFWVLNVGSILMLWTFYGTQDSECQTVASAESYIELGCFGDDPYIRDMQMGGFAFEELDLEICGSKCRHDGAAYMGLQKASICFCGSSFGRYGQVNETKCNYTCDGRRCGAYHLNSVYQTVNPDTYDEAQMDVVIVSEVKGFNEARMHCIQNRGDLVSMSVQRMVTLVNNILNKVNDSSPEYFWFGLGNVTLDGEDRLYWLNDLRNPHDPEDYSSNWEDEELFNVPCASVSRKTKKWRMIGCNVKQPFLCYQDSTPTSAPNTDQGGTSEEEGSGISKKITFYVIIPLFMLCYGGSFVFYVVYKGCRKFCRRKRYHNTFQNEITSDPETPPVRRNGFLTPIPDDQKHEPNITPPPYENKKPWFVEPLNVPQSKLAQNAENGNPPYRMNKQDKEATRRALLLQNALNEARERRRTETPGPGTQNGRNSRQSTVTPSIGQAPHDRVSSAQSNQDKQSSAPMDLSVTQILRMKQIVYESKQKRNSSAV